MKERNKVHQLIHSLNQGEKRYFKVFASQFSVGESNDFIRLFNAIRLQKEYNEEKIIRSFKGEKFVSHFSSKKVHLYNGVLRSLRLFHSGKTVDAILMDWLLSVRLLYNKGLYTHCTSLLNKAKAMAHHYEKFSLILKMLEWERNVVLINPTNIEHQLKQINKEKLSVLHHLNTIEKYHELLDVPIRYIYGHGFIRKKSDLQKLERMIHHPMLKKNPKSKSFSVLLGYYRTLAAYHVLKRNLNTCFVLRKKIVELYNSSPHMIGEDIENYINVNYGLLIIASEIKNTETIEKTIEQLTHLPHLLKHPLPPIMEARIFHLQYFYTLRSLVQQHKFERAADMEQIVLKGIEHRKSSLTPHLKIYLLQELAGALVFAGKLKNSLRLLNEIMHDKASEKPHNIMVTLRMLFLIIHFELSNEELLEYLTKSDERYFIKHKMLYRFEKVMLSSFKKLATTTEPDKQKIIFSNLKKELLLLKNDRFEGTPFVDFDYLLWLESKIKNHPFAEVLSRKAKLY